jgi:hypothetical protein
VSAFTFVINGETMDIDASPERSLEENFKLALMYSDNYHRPLDEWEIRHESGHLIVDIERPLAHFDANRPLFATLKVGAQG